MKVLHIIDSSGLYGAEIMLLNLIEEQYKSGIAPTIASIGEKNCEDKPLEIEALKRGFDVKKIRMKNGPNLIGSLKIARMAFNEGYKILHSHGYKGNILFGYLPKFIRKLPIVTTLHGWTSTNIFSKKKLYELVEIMSLFFIDSVVVVNKGMLSHSHLKNSKKLNLKIINNGIAISKNEKLPSDQLTKLKNIDKNIYLNNCFIIGSIGRLSKEKGYEFLIKAANELIKKKLNITVVIIGDGNQSKQLTDMARRYKLDEKVIFTGYRNDAKQYMPLFNVYVNSSLTEGLPITILEAMNAKVPIVATSVGGIPNVLIHNKSGLLVQPGNVNDISVAIEKIYKNKELADTLANNAFKDFIETYSSEKMATEYLKLYKALLK